MGPNQHETSPNLATRHHHWLTLMVWIYCSLHCRITAHTVLQLCKIKKYIGLFTPNFILRNRDSLAKLLLWLKPTDWYEAKAAVSCMRGSVTPYPVFAANWYIQSKRQELKLQTLHLHLTCSRCFRLHTGQLSLLTLVAREINTGQSAVMLCDWAVKAGMAQVCIKCVALAGKTCMFSR